MTAKQPSKCRWCLAALGVHRYGQYCTRDCQENARRHAAEHRRALADLNARWGR